MALSRLVLLCMVAFEVLDVQTKPVDFVCNSESRRDMNTVSEMKAAVADCSALSTLPSPVRLPCIKIHKASWERKSIQEKRGEIEVSLGALVQGVRDARTLSLTGCGSTLLERLEHRVKNYLHIVTQLDIRGAPETQPVCAGRFTHNLGTVLVDLDRLLTGKLEWLMMDLMDMCQTESPSYNS